MKKVGFKMIGQIWGMESCGSSRMRIMPMFKYDDNFHLWMEDETYDAIVFQKRHDIAHAKKFNGLKLLDVTDSPWLKEGNHFWNMCKEMDVIISYGIKQMQKISEMTKNIPIYLIPDRHDLDEIKINKGEHKGIGEKVIWYGHSANYPTLDSIYNDIRKAGYKLIVISPGNYKRADVNIKWELNSYQNHIISGDVVVNPYITTGEFYYKCNDKTTLAWMLGMPVANTLDELLKFKDPDERNFEIKCKQSQLDLWHIKHSAREYREIIEKHCREKFGDNIPQA